MPGSAWLRQPGTEFRVQNEASSEECGGGECRLEVIQRTRSRRTVSGSHVRMDGGDSSPWLEAGQHAGQ